MARLPRAQKRQDAKPRAARYENEGKPVPCANCKGGFVRRRRGHMYCRRPECRKEIQQRAHVKWYSRNGVEDAPAIRRRSDKGQEAPNGYVPKEEGRRRR